MSRTIPSNTDSSLDDDFIIPIFFIELDFDTDPLYVHTDLGSITVLSKTWLGTGGLGSISPIEETEEVKSPGLKIRMQITDESAGGIFEELTQQDFYQRTAILYFSTRDISTGALKDDPFEMFRGKVDVPELTYGGGESFVELLIESEWADGEIANGEMYSDAQLQSEYSGDLGFEFLTDMVNRKVVWGSNRVVSLGNNGGGGSDGTTGRFPGFGRFP